MTYVEMAVLATKYKNLSPEDIGEIYKWEIENKCMEEFDRLEDDLYAINNLVEHINNKNINPVGYILQFLINMA